MSSQCFSCSSQLQLLPLCQCVEEVKAKDKLDVKPNVAPIFTSDC